ncbi:hypothetical protein [endosymbiont of Ridgeia piscesae]|jgi:hypothetical protein|uniref:Uncharacterized protein n=1 Tax=endosymbiont of Ridgeia piscesae TaxID=54398 RepID=A0A0T5Z038_9GAMM|nr:hypothetical protein [endosymbiont of Ridgeia piscesae]KRT55838.1 hypothetical protein Ga0074115_12534 [endosymbiont of Ridgeia piscesae]KRT57102.1 hypothetical protein Ga0076813_108518 [endosymbiont of Ridgeia piscesae]
MNITVFILSAQPFDVAAKALRSYVKYNGQLLGKDVRFFYKSDMDKGNTLDPNDGGLPCVVILRANESLDFSFLISNDRQKIKFIYINHSPSEFQRHMVNLQSLVRKKIIENNGEGGDGSSLLSTGEFCEPFCPEQFDFFELCLFFVNENKKTPVSTLGIDLSMHCHLSKDSQFVVKRFDVPGFQAILKLLSKAGSLFRKRVEMERSDEGIDFLLAPPTVGEDPLDFINKNICDSRTADVICALREINDVIGGLDVFVNHNAVKNISLLYKILCSSDVDSFVFSGQRIQKDIYAKYKIFVVGRPHSQRALKNIISFDMGLPRTLFLYDKMYFNDITKMIGDAAHALSYYEAHNLVSEIVRLQDRTLRQELLEIKNVAFAKYRSRSIKQLMSKYRDHIYGD